MMHSRGQARQVEFSEKIDVYGFGILLWEIFRGEEWYPPHPFDEPSSYCDFVCDGKRPLLTNTRDVHWPPLLSDLCAACWAQAPSQRPTMEEVVTAVVGVEFEQWKTFVLRSISNDTAAAFWLQSFSDRKVPWLAFRGALTRHARLAGNQRPTPPAKSSSHAPAASNSEADGPAVRFGALRRLLCCDWLHPQQTLSDFVMIDAFNAAQATFGPFYARDIAQTILDDIESVATAQWFHGNISRQVAEERLKVTHRDLGTYLVRMSISQANVPFVISYVGSANGVSQIHHLKITRPVWGKPTLVMDGMQFKSLMECVARGRERNILLSVCDTTVPLSAYDENMT